MLGTLAQALNQPFEHQDSERQEVEAGQSCGEAFIVTSKAPKASCPPETPLDHPPTREEDEAFFGGWELDDLKGEPRLGGVLHRLRARIALIAIGDLDRLASRSLDLRR